MFLMIKCLTSGHKTGPKKKLSAEFKECQDRIFSTYLENTLIHTKIKKNMALIPVLQ